MTTSSESSASARTEFSFGESFIDKTLLAPQEVWKQAHDLEFSVQNTLSSALEDRHAERVATPRPQRSACFCVTEEQTKTRPVLRDRWLAQDSSFSYWFVD